MKNEERSSSNLICATSRMLNVQLKKALELAGVDLTTEQWTLLYYLWEEDQITQNELATRSRKEKSTIARHVDALEGKGYIIRKSHIADKRAKLIILTEKAKAVKSVALGAANSVTASTEEGIDKNDLDSFYRVMKKMMSNLERI